MAFSEALALLIALEGGYQVSDLPDDPGGATYAGITRAVWWEYCSRKGIISHWPPTQAEVGSFYLTEYWDARECASLADHSAAVWLQCAVDLPFAAGNQVLQNALEVWPDGAIGPKTLAAIGKLPAADLSAAILTAQTQHYIATRGIGDPLFKGLWDRVQTVRRYIAQGLI